MNVIEIERVSKSFGSTRAVNELSLTVPQGVIYGFIGPNGSGKSTTIRMIMRIYMPDQGSGELRVLGQINNQAVNDRIGYLPEERGLYKRMKVRELLEFLAELKGVKQARHAANHWLDRFDVGDWANKRVDMLSKGMAQKVQFIAAVINRPDLLILDEPFSGLDPVNATVIRDAIVELQKQGTTVIFSTHDMSVAEKMCDFIFMIFRGQKVLDGSLASIQARYGQDTVRLRLANGSLDYRQLPGVQEVADFGQLKELRLTPGADSQQLLQEVTRAGKVTHFELTSPSLHDIFVRIAGPAVVEAPTFIAQEVSL